MIHSLISTVPAGQWGSTSEEFIGKHEKGEYMPVITRFYGILIKMYFNEHGIPHFHAVYGEFIGVFKIQTIEMIEGDLPLRAQKMVKDWAKTYQEELMKMWKKREYKQLPGLK